MNCVTILFTNIGGCYVKPANFHLSINLSETVLRWRISRLNGRYYTYLVRRYSSEKQSEINNVRLIEATQRYSNKTPIQNVNVYLNQSVRSYTSEEPSKRSNIVSSPNPKVEDNKLSTNVVETIKETTKTVSYLGISLVGVGVACLIVYTIFSELFSSNSPNNIYSRAFDYVSKDERVLNAIGDSIKGYGEETRRGRRQHVVHAEYEKDGVDFLRMKFYIKGSRKRGTVNLEMMKDSRGKYQYRYLFVVVTEGYTQSVIILEDNRHKDEIAQNSNLLDFQSGGHIS